jgi:hypothetical protein
LTAPVRALLTVAGDELRKDGGNRANRVPRADRTEQPKGWAPNLGIRCAVNSKPFFVRRKTMQLASRFASRSPVLRSNPLSDDQIRRGPVHLRGRPARKPLRAVQLHPHRHRAAELRKEGFEPFMVTQTRVRHDDRRDTPST